MNEPLPYGDSPREDVSPYPSGLVEGLRDVGYTPQTAVADIIDNSVTAGANKVDIKFDWNGKKSTITVLDNGKGMSDSELISAMRPGSMNPWQTRSQADLGRFGLGLKTASFSQCRKFTVVSKKLNEKVSYWTWDLDLVADSGKWEIVRHISDTRYLAIFDGLEQGTLIIWEKLDRIVGVREASDQHTQKHFLQIAEDVKRHLEMVFHRYLEKGNLAISFNDRNVEPWDPFLKGHPSTQVFPDELISNGQVIVKPYILPHRSKLDDETYQKAQGPGGWDAQQGFYIYRNERLLVSADWLGFFRKDGHHKLARILIDLPNSLDNEWSLDIKKSRAKPPFDIAHELHSISTKVRANAEEIFRHRGKQIQRSISKEFEFVWQEKIKHNKVFYVINRDHSYLKFSVESFPEQRKQLNRLLKIIEETIPIRLAIASGSEHQDKIASPFEQTPTHEIVEFMKVLYKNWLNKGMTTDQIKQKFHRMEPFNNFPQLIQTLSDD